MNDHEVMAIKALEAERERLEGELEKIKKIEKRYEVLEDYRIGYEEGWYPDFDEKAFIEKGIRPKRDHEAWLKNTIGKTLKGPLKHREDLDPKE